MTINDNKVRVYDLAKELKQDTKRIIEELRREGADISVPSNSVSKELADKIISRYFPKAETTPKRTIKVIRKKSDLESSNATSKTAETEKQLNKPQLDIEANTNYQKASSNDIVVNKVKIDCRECLRPTKHTLKYSTKAEGIKWDEKYEIVQCNGCESVSFRRITIKESNQLNNIEEIDLYPSRIIGRKILKLKSIPSTITLIYEEIHLALSNKLLVLATVGMRTLIELICKDFGSEEKYLKNKIDNLVERQLITPKNAKNLHKLRDLGNYAAHEADIQSEDTLNICMDTIEHLLKDIYSLDISKLES